MAHVVHFLAMFLHIFCSPCRILRGRKEGGRNLRIWPLDSIQYNAQSSRLERACKVGKPLQLCPCQLVTSVASFVGCGSHACVCISMLVFTCLYLHKLHTAHRYTFFCLAIDEAGFYEKSYQSGHKKQLLRANDSSNNQ